MKWPVLVAMACISFAARPTWAQTVRVRLDAVGLTYQESREGRQAIGAGGGGGLEVRLGRFRLDGRVFKARLEPEDAGAAAYDLAQTDVRLTYLVTPFLGVDVGGGRRYVEPAFAAQEVGFLRVGVSSENALNRLARVSVRGAYLVGNRFSGGGDAELAFELGLGVGVGTANGRFRVDAGYEFQRIDRRVAGSDVPLQVSLARLGIALGF